MKGEISSRKRFVFVLAAAFAVATVTYGWLKAQDAPMFAPGSMRARAEKTSITCTCKSISLLPRATSMRKSLIPI